MKVLIAEDDPVGRRLLEAFLQEWGYDVLATGDGREAWEIIQEPESPNLIISDWIMPHMDGVELCEKIRQMERSDYIYFIILTAKTNKEDVIKGLKSGADDFIIKPFDNDELKHRLKIGERIIKLERHILQLANTDSLTGVLNRRAFTERMEEEVHRCRRENRTFSLIMTDIDYFKKVNDRYGHSVGDLVLQRFAEQLIGSTRPYDKVARYGGEEFVVGLLGSGQHQSGSVAERLRKNVEEMKIPLPDGSQSIQITASFGTASFLLEPEESVNSLIKRADDALYRAKDEGRNRVCTSENSIYEKTG
jgi:two-component system chemotaxis response regulator CheY